MKKVNYISNLSLGEVSGGWSGINLRLHNELDKKFAVQYIGPINPPSNKAEKIYSKLRRTCGLKGNFHFFSNKRLGNISGIIEKEWDPQADYNFFFGNTPWIKVHSKIGYGVYMDAAFPTYLALYSTPEKFIDKDVERIYSLERDWLRKATHLFFGSTWAKEEAFKHYNFTHPDAHVVCTGGNVPLPTEDTFKGKLSFLFISLNFKKKGGILCWEAFKELKERYPSARLQIIGEQPPPEVMGTVGVEYLGRLDKNKPEDMALLVQTLSQAFFLIHPTTMDTMGAVIVEAGYYGCPSVAPKSFGIPDLIKDQETGILLDVPLYKNQLIEKVSFYLENRDLYLKMRQKVKNFTESQYSWTAIGKKISNIIANGL